MFQIQNRLGKTKVVGHMEIVEDLLAIPSDISFATKASGEIPDDNSFVTSESNSFATSKQSKRSKSLIARGGYLLQLEKKIVHNNHLLTTLLSSANISSLDKSQSPPPPTNALTPNYTINTHQKQHYHQINATIILPPWKWLIQTLQMNFI